MQHHDATPNDAQRAGAAGEGEPARKLAEQLGPLVEGEARRLLSDEQLLADPALTAEGWVRRFIADGRRAEEAMELYRHLGFEVRAEPVRAEQVTDDCEDCQLLIALEFQTIYTRKR